MKHIFLLLFNSIIVANLSAQDYVTNIRINSNSENIEIIYDLEQSQERRMISRLYSVDISYSNDNGVTFVKIDNANGDVGEKIKYGNDRKIIWTPPFGLVGNFIFKVSAHPIYENGNWGLQYSSSEFVKIDEGTKHNSIKTYFTVPLRRGKGSTLYYIGYKFHDSEYDSGWIIPIGIGYQPRNKSFSPYVGIGFGQTTPHKRPGVTYYYNHELGFTAEAGFLLRFPFIRNPYIVIPCEVSLISEGGVAFMTGLGIQFPIK